MNEPKKITTDEVREAWIDHQGEHGTLSREEAEAAFDEWVDGIREAGREAGLDAAAMDSVAAQYGWWS